MQTTDEQDRDLIWTTMDEKTRLRTLLRWAGGENARRRQLAAEELPRVGGLWVYELCVRVLSRRCTDSRRNRLLDVLRQTRVTPQPQEYYHIHHAILCAGREVLPVGRMVMSALLDARLGPDEASDPLASDTLSELVAGVHEQLNHETKTANPA